MPPSVAASASFQNRRGDECLGGEARIGTWMRGPWHGHAGLIGFFAPAGTEGIGLKLRESVRSSRKGFKVLTFQQLKGLE